MGSWYFHGSLMLFLWKVSRVVYDRRLLQNVDNELPLCLSVVNLGTRGTSFEN